MSIKNLIGNFPACLKGRCGGKMKGLLWREGGGQNEKNDVHVVYVGDKGGGGNKPQLQCKFKLPARQLQPQV